MPTTEHRLVEAMETFRMRSEALQRAHVASLNAQADVHTAQRMYVLAEAELKAARDEAYEE